MKNISLALIAIMFLVACSPKYTEINDQGFGGGFSHPKSGVSKVSKQEEVNTEAVSMSDDLLKNDAIEISHSADAVANKGIQKILNVKKLDVQMVRKSLKSLVASPMKLSLIKNVKKKLDDQSQKTGLAYFVYLFLFGLTVTVISGILAVSMFYSAIATVSLPTFILALMIWLVFYGSLIFTVVMGLAALIWWVIRLIKSDTKTQNTYRN